MKRIVRLTESDLHRIVNESVKKVLINEGWFDRLFGKKQPQRQIQQQESPMAKIIRERTRPDGKIANDDDPLDERINIGGTVEGTGLTHYFGSVGSLVWNYGGDYPGNRGTRNGFNPYIKEENGGRFTQIQYFSPKWSGNRRGGMTITFWKVLSDQELQRVEQVVVNNDGLEDGIVPFVQKIDAVLTKEGQEENNVNNLSEPQRSAANPNRPQGNMVEPKVPITNSNAPQKNVERVGKGTYRIQQYLTDIKQNTQKLVVDKRGLTYEQAWYTYKQSVSWAIQSVFSLGGSQKTYLELPNIFREDLNTEAKFPQTNPKGMVISYVNSEKGMHSSELIIKGILDRAKELFFKKY